MKNFYQMAQISEARRYDEVPKEELDRWKNLWKTNHKHSYIYHPEFDYQSPVRHKNTHGVFWIGHNGEKFMLMSMYHPFGETFEKMKPILAFYVSMPGFHLEDKPTALVYGKPIDLVEEYGIDEFDIRSAIYKPYIHINERPEGWNYVKLDRSSRSYQELIGLIKKNWVENKLKHDAPLPDYKHHELQDEIMDIIIGSGHSGMGERGDYTYPDPDSIKDS